MKKILHENETFGNIDYSEKGLPRGEYVKCLFRECNFTGSSLADLDFIDCQFTNCNLSMVKIDSTGLKNVFFTNSKVIGVDFSGCKDFLLSVGFENCILDYSFFLKKKLRNIVFRKCSIKEANFADTDLTNARFLDCDLLMTQFEKTLLNGADFTTSFNFIIDPEMNKMKNARFSVNGLAGLLSKYGIVIE